MSPYLSDKIKVISLIAITMVIYIHTYYTEGENYPLFMSLQRILGGVGISGVANPLFYFTSGYLFFLSINNIKDCFFKIKKRIRTLLIPYILVNSIAFLMYAGLDAVSRTSPSLYNVVNFHILNWFSHGVGKILYNIYWMPVAFQLWFVRDMLIFVILSPFIYIVLKTLSANKYLTIITLTLLSTVYFTTSIHVLWMAIGGIISLSGIVDITKSEMTKARTTIMYVSIIVFIGFVVINSIGIYELKFGYALFGVIAAWLLYDKIVKGRTLLQNIKLAQACSYSFFIYLIHEPTLIIFKKIPLIIWGNNETTLIISFIIIPIIFVTITIIIGKILKKHIPNAYSILTGGR